MGRVMVRYFSGQRVLVLLVAGLALFVFFSIQAHPRQQTESDLNLQSIAKLDTKTREVHESLLSSGHKRDTILVGGEPQPEKPLKGTPLLYLGILRQTLLASGNSLAVIHHAVYPGVGLALVSNGGTFLKWIPDAQLEDWGRGQLKSPGEYLDWWKLEDLNKDNKEELAIRFGIAGTAQVHPFYLYAYDGEEDTFELLLKLVNPSSQTAIKDLDSDNIYEFVHSYSLSGSGKLERDLLRFKDIWRLQDGKPIKVNHLFPQEYQELIDLHTLALTKEEWEGDVSFYYPVLRCLKEKTELTSQGKEIGINECQEILRKRYAGSDE